VDTGTHLRPTGHKTEPGAKGLEIIPAEGNTDVSLDLSVRPDAGGEHLRMTHDVDGSPDSENGRETPGVVVVAVTEENGAHGGEVFAEDPCILDDAEALTGVEQIVAVTGFQITGESVLAHDTKRDSD
jgi:hypothetical protein